jgi:hypothetical protein
MTNRTLPEALTHLQVMSDAGFVYKVVALPESSSEGVQAIRCVLGTGAAWLAEGFALVYAHVDQAHLLSQVTVDEE